ncbi:MAG: alkaline shock response membrane anchor protein AmaP [Chloroflexota bacterium]|nr:alkaline shock response membrane anchor protein AmaP [Chloroflexota bacterium]
MNIFNRVIMVLAIIVALAVVAFIMIRPLWAVDLVRLGLGYFEQVIFDEQLFYIFLAVTGGLGVILLILLWLELRRRSKNFVEVDIEGGGKARLSIASVAQSVEYRIDELPGVRKVKPKIKSRGRDLDVTIDLDTSPSVNIPVLSAKVVDLCRDILEGQLGVKIHNKVQVNIKHEPYPRGTMPSTEPFGEETLTELPSSERKQKEAPEPSTEPEPASTEQEEGEASDEEPSEISANW